jgi:signal transduction histidine kinase/streptogramin lyase
LYRRAPDGRTARYTAHDGLPGNFLSDLFEDRKGRLWGATRTGGFFRFDSGGAAPVFHPPFVHGLTTPWIYQLFETSDGRFWAATNNGLAESTAPGEPRPAQFRVYGAGNGLSHYEITTLTEDIAGNLWMGTGAAGAMKLTRGGFTTYGRSDWLGTVTAGFEDQAGRMCFRAQIVGTARTTVFDEPSFDILQTEPTGFHQRFGCIEGQRFSWFIPAAIGNYGWVTERVTLRSRSGEWWIGAGDGLYRFPAVDNLADLKTARPTGFYAGPQVYRLFEDSKGNIWFSGTSAELKLLSRWERLTGRARDVGSSPGLSALHHDWPARSFGEDPAGNIWIGFDGELARYRDGAFVLFTEAEGVPPGPIRDIHVDRAGRVWLASSVSGLVRLEGPASARPSFARYTTRQGLSSDNLEVIAEDEFGHIYTGGGDGLDRLDPATGRVKHFAAADGFPPGVIKFGFRDRHGVLWFGLSNGLARFVPARENPMAPPPVLISGVRVAGVVRRVSALGERRMSLPDLAPRQNQLEIDFLGLGFGPGEVLGYQFRLEGAGDDWSALSAQRTVTYASLAPGQYTFAVRAVNSDGLPSVAPATVTFRISRPVWQRWWFVAAAALALGLLGHGAFRYRVNRLLEVAHMRTHIATDLHDDIGANLTRIALLSEVAVRTGGQAPVVSIARIARESISAMSDIVWAINPERESLLDLTRRMRQHADELFTSRGIELRFDGPTTGAGTLKLGMDVRRDLLLVFKEAVNNAARHSRCSAVEITLSVEHSCTVLAVSDNGAGFDVSSGSEGNGLASMRKRAQRMRGTLAIESRDGKGTRVTLTCPYQPGPPADPTGHGG